MATIDHVLLTDTFGHWVITTNEIIDLVNAELGTDNLSLLLTTDKSSLVAAINELYNTKYDKTGGQITGNANITGSLQLNDLLTVGANGEGDSCIAFYDDTNNSTHLLCWDDAGSKWTIEDVAGVTQDLFHSGLDLDLGGLSSLTTDTQLLFKGGTEAENDAYTGGVNELTLDLENLEVRVHDGVTPGGAVIAGGDTNPVVEVLDDGVDYVSGTSTSLTLVNSPFSEDNLILSFDGVVQAHDEYSVVANVVTLNDPVPPGTNKIEAWIVKRIGGVFDIGVPGDNTVGLDQLEHQTQGDLITFTTAGVPAILPTGNINEVLVSKGAGADLEYEKITTDHVADATRGSLLTWVAGQNPSYLGPGNAGQILTANGAGANLSWEDLVTGTAEVFTGSGTWNKPSQGSYVIVYLWGGGAGGSDAVGQRGGGGGGSFAMAKIPFTDLGSSESVTVGAGGVPGDFTTTPGPAYGGNTTFGSHVTAYGGGPAISSGGGLGGGGGGIAGKGSKNWSTGANLAIIGGGPNKSLGNLDDTKGVTVISEILGGGDGGRVSGGYRPRGGDSIFGGGGGSVGNGAFSFYGGGGGEGQAGTFGGGPSVFGGKGGDNTQDGEVPGGGGGAQANGGDGLCIVIVV